MTDVPPYDFDVMLADRKVALTNRPTLGIVLLSEYGDVSTSGAAATAFTAALAAISSDGTVINPKNSALDLSAVTIPNGVTVIDYETQRTIWSNTGVGLSTQAGGGTLNIQDARADHATRVFVQPKGRPDGVQSKLDIMADDYEANGSSVGYQFRGMFTYRPASGTLPYGSMMFDGIKSTQNYFGIYPIHMFGANDALISRRAFFYVDYSDPAPWRAPYKGAWYAGKTGIAINDYITSPTAMYKATTAGTCGATIPSHTVGTVSDGGVSWAFERNFVAASASFDAVEVFGNHSVDIANPGAGTIDRPKLGTALKGISPQFARGTAIWNGTKHHFLDSTGAIVWTIYNPVGTDDLYFESADGTKRYRFDFTGGFMQATGLSRLLATVVATDADTTPSIKGLECLTVSNTGATTITAFDDGVANQTFFVEATNGNTTLTHNASIILTGAANITMATGRVIQFKCNSAGSVARMVG